MLLLAGAMDGSVTVLAAASGKILARHKSHAKYCVRVRWASDGQRFVSCSWDNTLAVHRYHSQTDTPSIELLRTEAYLSQVQDIEFVPTHGQENSSMLVIALKNTNYLRLYDIESLKVSKSAPTNTQLQLLQVILLLANLPAGQYGNYEVYTQYCLVCKIGIIGAC